MAKQSKTLAGMADRLMTKEQKAKADQIRQRPDRHGHEKKNGLDK